ncbi:conserved hypothetical protein [Leishmania infantum JPCM5]|uniref:Uncharacterized protein n=2 Tax=Leishmania infantum TaxID=5671 RepID=A4I8M0_LEIIN|nr:conserved hypothetical protein [Leishmania infantum JPCM5]CAC9529276.1 hypothetical_protein_-_conserved [Leishmania infantum]CAM71166.1 conserved hypothetical protein [Leishmania infantum JPCM5]SUZ44991.1 hypothetical_protein_-_conserved [Leishmania infantum]|eukprot:XP_001468089.1 conserved hypothetical protein [Leishmania infantum JPCM5]
MRRGLVLRATRVNSTAYRCFLQALRQCGVEYAPALPEKTPGSLSHTPAAPFSPLFTTQFDAHQHQLTTLGDALVDRYLSGAVLKYCSRRGITLTTNAASELNAVLHNHFALRLFAKELHFDAMGLTREEADCESSDPSAASPLHFLEAETPLLRSQDVAGTSYQVALLPCGQSSLGWKFSHFVGAVHQSLGLDAATRVLDHVYQLDDESNVPRQASRLLLRALEHFPAMNLAEAILAVQGLSVHYTTRSRVLPGNSEQSAEYTRAAQAPPSERPPPNHGVAVGNSREGDADGLALVAGFSPTGTKARDITLESLTGGSPLPSSLASGPGLMDAVDVWRRRTQELVARQLEPAPEAAAAPASSTAATDGWLSAQERVAYQRGPAFAGWVDVASTPSFADIYGTSQPEDGHIVRRTKFKKQVRDPRFYDKMSDARNGVPFDTNGEPLTEYLDRFAKPHQRIFEVTMQSGAAGELKLIGRAISTRYTTARESACRSFIGGVLHDMLTLAGATDAAAAATGPAA